MTIDKISLYSLLAAIVTFGVLFTALLFKHSWPMVAIAFSSKFLIFATYTAVNLIVCRLFINMSKIDRSYYAVNTTS